jgi:hypothetical protein
MTLKLFTLGRLLILVFATCINNIQGGSKLAHEG